MMYKVTSFSVLLDHMNHNYNVVSKWVQINCRQFKINNDQIRYYR